MSTQDGYWQRNPGEVERARVMWEQGLSASTIGRVLNVTKNALLGLKNRQGWEPRGSPIKSGSARPDVGIRQEQRRIRTARIGPISLLPLASAAIVVPVEAAPKKKPEPPKEAPRVVPRSKRQCEFLFGDKPFRRCENAAWPGYPYCAECSKRAYQNWHGLEVEVTA